MNKLGFTIPEAIAGVVLMTLVAGAIVETIL